MKKKIKAVLTNSNVLDFPQLVKGEGEQIDAVVYQSRVRVQIASLEIDGPPSVNFRPYYGLNHTLNFHRVCIDQSEGVQDKINFRDGASKNVYIDLNVEKLVPPYLKFSMSTV